MYHVRAKWAANAEVGGITGDGSAYDRVQTLLIGKRPKTLGSKSDGEESKIIHHHISKRQRREEECRRRRKKKKGIN